MYSSFKKQQLITESWRRFLLEASEEEKKHFGDWIDEEFLDQFQKYIYEKSQDYYLEEVPTDKLKFIGQGSFRGVYRPKGDKDYVVKFALGDDGREMNKTEFEFQTKNDLFAKVFKHSDDFSWIVMESLRTIKKISVFNNFFPEIASMFNQLGMEWQTHRFITETVFGPLKVNNQSGALSPRYPDASGWDIAYKDVIIAAFHRSAYLDSPEFQDKILVPGLEELRKKIESEGDPEKLNEFMEMQKSLFDKKQSISIRKEQRFKLLFSILEKILEQRLIQFCISFPLVQRIRRAIKDFGLLHSEIRVLNTGVNSKGEFKILDASVEEQIG